MNTPSKEQLTSDFIFEEQYEIDSLKKKIKEKEKELAIFKEEFFKNYFENLGIDYSKVLPINAKKFITYPKFEFHKSETGDTYWIAKGYRVTIKNGEVTYGHSIDELYQGQFESLPKTIQKLTIQEARENDKPIFEISPKVFKGVDHAAIGLILHEKNKWQLVWRQGGSAYIDRSSKSLAASSSLQIIYAGDSHKEQLESWTEIKPKVEKILNKNYGYTPSYFDISEGGRFSSATIENHKESIDFIFGDGTSDSIILKINEQQEMKKNTKKRLKI